MRAGGHKATGCVLFIQFCDAKFVTSARQLDRWIIVTVHGTNAARVGINYAVIAVDSITVATNESQIICWPVIDVMTIASASC